MRFYIEVENVSKRFGKKPILENISLSVEQGQTIGLVGANGEGKSTFMNIITGKLMPDEGKVEWAKNVRVGYLDRKSGV